MNSKIIAAFSEAFSVFKLDLINFMCFSCMYVWATHACLVKRVWDPLELELQMVMNYHVGAGNGKLIPYKSSKDS